MTNLDETLDLLDVRDLKHARPVRPSAEMVDLENVESTGSLPAARDKGRYLRLPSNEQLWSHEGSQPKSSPNKRILSEILTVTLADSFWVR